MSTFAGFSDEDLKRIKSGTHNELPGGTVNVKRIDKLGIKNKKLSSPYKLPLKTETNDDSIENINFDKCKLSLKSAAPTSDILNNNIENVDNSNTLETLGETEIIQDSIEHIVTTPSELYEDYKISEKTENLENGSAISNNTSENLAACDNYMENDLVAHKAKLEDLQLRQKLMEEQNKKRKEMLSKALADRAKQTEVEVLKLEKIKKELQVLDGQFSHDVAMLRKKIDQACVSYSEAEKCYLKVEKEFLQAKINLQKEKEKKELLTEHLCQLITHNETRKAQKLETLMMQLAYGSDDDKVDQKNKTTNDSVTDCDDEPRIVDGVDERTGKIVEMELS